jgi:hypothetical protein
MDNAEAYQETSFTSNGYPEMVQRARGKEIVREASKGRSVQYENEALPCYGYTNSKDMEWYYTPGEMTDERIMQRDCLLSK